MKKLIALLLFISFTQLHSQTDYTFIYNNDSIIKKGSNLHDQQKYAEAIKEYNRIDKLDPKYLDAQYKTALALSALGKKNELKALYEDLYKKNQMQKLPTLYTLYASFLSDENQYDASEKIFKEGEKYQPNSANFLYNFAILYIRKKDTQKGVDILEHIILTSPNHSSSHYLLGLIAFENGNITEGTLALMSYLIIAPTGKFAEKAITELNQKFGQNYLVKGPIVFSKSGDQFEEIETILRNQLPLKSAYKVKSDIDDVIIRQAQAVAEYSVDHKMGNGFFETTYIPWIKDVVQKNYFEELSYYILLSMEDKLGKKITSNKKKLTAFYDNYLLKDFWPLYAKRKQNHFGHEEEVITIYKNGNPYLVGAQINGKKEGKYKYLNEFGNLAGEINFKDDQLNGFQKYYDNEGKPSEEKTFVNGKVDGARTGYYPNGSKSFIENYKDDLLDGAVTGFYINGGKKYELNFTKNQRDGKQLGFYANGSKKSETNYTNGKFNGPYLRYNEVGDLIESCTYVNDLLEGNYFEYFDGKTVKSEAVYLNGKVQGSYKKYYTNKALEKENFYENGKLKKCITYYANGKKDNEYEYNDKEDLENIVSYDSKGNKFFEEKHKSDDLKSAIQYLSTNPKPIEISASKKPFAMYYYSNAKMAVGNFEKGKKAKEWNYYFPSGILRSTELYDNRGRLNGISRYFHRNGSPDAIKNFVNDSLNGVYEVYEKGVLNRTFCYSKGAQNGPFKSFYPDGKIDAEGYLENGETNYTRLNYWQSGIISSEETYVDDIVTTSQVYSPKGEKESYVDYKNRTGKFDINFNEGVYSISSEMTNGLRNGKTYQKDKMNTPILEAEFINGLRHNGYKIYGPMGVLQTERTYYADKINGIDKEYDIAGNLRLIDENFFGDQHGKTTRYYHNKSKFVEYFEMDGALDGDYTYYNQGGTPILILEYENNSLVSYSVLDKNGELKDKKTVKEETATIASSYPNGKTAITMNFIKGSINGKISIGNPEGKSEFQSEYSNGQLSGERIEYYANGNLYKKEHFKDGAFEGVQEFYKENGKLSISATYKNDQLNGKTLIYDNGKLLLTKLYDTNELVEIIK